MPASFRNARPAHRVRREWLLALFILWPAAPRVHAEPLMPGAECRETSAMMVCVRVNTPEQMAAFYEARGFPRRAIDEITRYCFMTVAVENRSDTILWLETARWRIESGGGRIRRLDPAWWERRWDTLDVPAGNRATFTWTQLPSARDLHPDESVGGNIVIPATDTPVSLYIGFGTGPDGDGETIHVHFDDLHCQRQDAP